MDKDLEKEIKEKQKKLAELKRKQEEAEKEEADLASKLKDPDAPEIVDTEPLALEPEVKKTRKPRGKKADTNSWEPSTSKPSSKKKSTNYDEIVGNWIDQETKDRKEGSFSPYSSPEPEQGVDPDLEPTPQTPVEPPPIPKTLALEDKVETIARKHKGELTKDELEFYFENRDAIYEAMNRQSDEEFGIKAPGTSAPKEEEAEEIEEAEPLEPEPTAPKTKEQTETEFELTRRLYFEYSTGSAKFKKESELFKEHALEKEKAYKEARNSAYQQMVDEGRIDEANDFIVKEFELKRAHEIKHGPLWTKLKGGASQKIEAWDKWGVDKEGADWNEKLGNWNKRVFKRAVNIAFIGLTSSAAVAGLASKGIGTATALSGGVLSRLGYKLGWGVTLGTASEYLMSKVPQGVDAEKAKRVLKKVMIGGGALGAGYILATGVSLVGLGVGASAAVGYGISRYTERKGWTEKSIKEKKENAKNNFNVNNLDDLEKHEEAYLKILKEAENSRIYRKLANTITAIMGSTASLELMGYTKDNTEEIKQVYGNSFKNFWSGVKKWWAKPWFSEEKDSKAIEVNPDHPIRGGNTTPIPERKLETQPSHQDEAPKKSEAITGSEQKDNDGNNGEKNTHEKTNHEDHRNKNHVGKKDYSGVHKTWMNNTGGNINNHENHHIENTHGKAVGYTDISGYRNHATPYSIEENPNHNTTPDSHERVVSISSEEMADKIYSKNLNMILSTPESRAIWENIKDDDGETNVNTFLTINREDLGSVQIKNLQDYILKVIDEVKLKPQKYESIEGFLSRAFEKASHRPKMLEGLQL